MALEQSRAGERRWRKFVVAAMLNPFTLPALGGSVIAAVVVGIQLGQSSIGLINPIYFQGPALHPRERGAALDENAVRPRPAVYAQLYGWDEGQVARAADCGDCAALQARDAHAYSAQVPYFGSREDERASDVGERVAVHRGNEQVVEVAFAAEETEPAKAPMLRYAYYPVEEPADLPEEPADVEKVYQE